MKKTALTAALFLIFLLPKQSAEAACNKSPAGAQVPGAAVAACGKRVACQSNDPFHLGVTCCDSPIECPVGTKLFGASQVTQVCDVIQDTNQRAACKLCMGNGDASWTAIGCIETEPSKFIAKFLTLGIGLAGGIAFLLILFAGFQILTSAGNPEQLNAGKELMGSSIAGLLLIIFSIFLLRVIGVNILGIPGFN